MLELEKSAEQRLSTVATELAKQIAYIGKQRQQLGLLTAQRIALGYENLEIADAIQDEIDKLEA